MIGRILPARSRSRRPRSTVSEPQSVHVAHVFLHQPASPQPAVTDTDTLLAGVGHGCVRFCTTAGLPCLALDDGQTVSGAARIASYFRQQVRAVPVPRISIFINVPNARVLPSARRWSICAALPRAGHSPARRPPLLIGWRKPLMQAGPQPGGNPERRGGSRYDGI